MATQQSPSGNNRTPGQKFADLTRRILTTPKSELLKQAPKPAARKRKH